MRRPSPGRILGRIRERLGRSGPPAGGRRARGRALGERLRGAGYLAGDIASLAADGTRRAAGAVADGFRGFWSGLSIEARRRFVAALGAALAALLFLSLAVPNLPCELPGGDECPPPDDAEELVPADALLYAHLNLDRDSDQYEDAAKALGAAPVFIGEIVDRALALMPGPGGAPPSFEREIEPWLGDEVAVALVSGGGSGGSAAPVFLLEVGDAGGAAEFADAIVAGRPQPSEYQGIALTVDGRGIATAEVGDFLAIGSPAPVRAVIDTETGADGAASVAADERAGAVREELPDHRLIEAYLSAEGVAELVAADRGPLGSLTTFLAPGATRGAAAALAATDDGLELSLRSVLDRERARSRPSFFAAFSPVEPELTERLRPDALGYVGIGDPGRTFEALLAQATAQQPGIAAGFEGLARSLRRRGEVDIERDLLPALGGEAAFALEPGPASEERPGRPPLPYLVFLADGVDEERAREALAGLQAPVAKAIDPALQAPVFGQRELGGVEARTLRVSPTVELSYAVFDGVAAVATDPLGIERLAEGDGGLDGADAFRDATEDLGGDQVALLAYLDLARLVELGEALGLADDPVYATFAAEFRRLDKLGLAVRSESDLLSTDARLLLRGPEPEAREPDPLAPPTD